MRKKQGRAYTVYVPEQLMAEAKLLADRRDKSTSQIVSNALREFLNRKAAEQGAINTPSA